MFNMWIVFALTSSYIKNSNSSNSNNSNIKFENIIDKYTISSGFLDNVVMLINNGYIPFNDYTKNGICSVEKSENEKDLFRDEMICEMNYTYKLIKKMNIEYIPFEIIKLIIRDINKQIRYEKETLYMSTKYKRRLLNYIRLNYIEYTNSPELENMQSICYIKYDNLDYNIIKKKYDFFINKEKYNIKKSNYTMINILLYILIIYIIIT